jgi:hypothetical protein
MHSSFLILHSFKAGKYLTDVEKFSMTIAAIVHDLGHPGTNNAYHVNKRTQLSIIYNDTSVLESYHCARAFTLFSQEQFDVLACLDDLQRKEARRQMIMCIMATDMVYHFALKADLDKLTGRIASAPEDTLGEGGILKDVKDRDLLMKNVLHTADVSNPCKAWKVCKKWSDMVVDEFFAQGDLEKSEELPISMNCDRVTTIQDELSMNFSDFIVGPLYISITALAPDAFPTCVNLRENRNLWFDLYKSRNEALEDVDTFYMEKLGKWNDRADGTNAKFAQVIDEAKQKLAL